jgi:hypothetical protein
MSHPRPKPDGSNIEEIDDFEGRTYRWKRPSGGPFHFLIAGFLIFWLCGWAVGFVMVTVAIVQKNDAPVWFLATWLAGWTLGGIFAISMLYFLLRPPHPESICLKHDSFHYDSGTFPVITFFTWYAMHHARPNDPFNAIFKRRQRIEIAKKNLGSIVLERIGERQRLYFDNGADRVEIGEFLREPEREWLAEVINAWKAT